MRTIKAFLATILIVSAAWAQGVATSQISGSVQDQSGAAVAGTSNLSTTGTNADVYQLFVIAKDAWGHVKFRGMDAFKYKHIPVDQVDKSDPTGERGYCSSTFYDAGLVTNHGWMSVCEITVNSLV